MDYFAADETDVDIEYLLFLADFGGIVGIIMVVVVISIFVAFVFVFGEEILDKIVLFFDIEFHKLLQGERREISLFCQPFKYLPCGSGSCYHPIFGDTARVL